MPLAMEKTPANASRVILPSGCCRSVSGASSAQHAVGCGRAVTCEKTRQTGLFLPSSAILRVQSERRARARVGGGSAANYVLTKSPVTALCWLERGPSRHQEDRPAVRTHLPKRAAAMIRETLKWTRSLRISIRDTHRYWHHRVVVPDAMAIASSSVPRLSMSATTYLVQAGSYGPRTASCSLSPRKARPQKYSTHGNL